MSTDHLTSYHDLPHLRSLFVRPSWMEHAACRGMPVELFFPERGEPVKNALETCKKCPVRQQCLDMAINNPEREGIWGGQSSRSRRVIRRNLRRRRDV